MWRLEAIGCAAVGMLTGMAIAAGILIRQNQRGELVGQRFADNDQPVAAERRCPAPSGVR